MSIADPQHPSNRLLQLLVDGTTFGAQTARLRGCFINFIPQIIRLINALAKDTLKRYLCTSELALLFFILSLFCLSLFCLSSLYGSTASILHINLFYGVL